ncbi:MAG: hypothetical protein JXJ04_23710 [Spirochaetales bacterium]|nr:hypothetical protein [Spirochaetales bacterium]
MCTSFVYRKKSIIVGMNYDNDGKEILLSTKTGNDFLISVKIRGTLFPSAGINREGIFINDQTVDSEGEGKYKRQTDKRWVTTAIVNKIMNNELQFDDLEEILGKTEIMNGPFTSTHNLIVNKQGSTCLIEPGRKNIFSTQEDSSFYTLTNFPLSEYDDLQPEIVSGSGSDRYLAANSFLKQDMEKLTPIDYFELLKKVSQKGPEWSTEVSLIYDVTHHLLYLCFHNNFDSIYEYSFENEQLTPMTDRTKSIGLSKKGIKIGEIVEK